MSDEIATYTFLPWVRQGLASKISTDDNLGSGAEPAVRASVQLALQVNGDPNFVPQNVELIGPGDVIGVSPRAIVRTEPRNWVTDFEPNYLAFIEFYEEDFPWRFTPAHAVQTHVAGNPGNLPEQQTKLRPWVILLVLEEGEFEEFSGGPGPLPAIKLAETADREAILPPANQAWAWAHVHISRDITSAGADIKGNFENVVRQNPDHALSRLICPRKLRPSAAYHAFLIPSFEVGRLAGLGESTDNVDTLLPSWGADQEIYPVYYRWYFRTGQRGDFEYLVNLLEPREVDERVGIRDMDMQESNFGVTGMTTGPHDLPVMGLEGALKTPKATSKPGVWPPANPAHYPAFLRDLEKMVNLQEMLQQEDMANVQDTLFNLQDPENNNPDPIISPPLYGRWHALQTRLEVGQPGWVNELNQDPRLRVPAGFGTKVIQAGQEGYMKKAWQQLGDILRANQKIRQLQVSVMASIRIYDRHFKSLDAGQQIALTRQVHARVMGSPTTVYDRLRQHRLEGAALQPAFRRIVRPGGAIMRKALPQNQGRTSDLLVKLNEGTISAARPKEPPQEQISLTKMVDRLNVPELHEDKLTAAAAADIEVLPDFGITLPDQPIRRAAEPLREENIEGKIFHKTLMDLHTRLEISLPAPEPRPQANIDEVSKRLVEALNPKSTILRRARSVISIPDTFQYLPTTETIVPIMAHPVFADPMYKPLRDLSSELLIPNLNLIPNNSITLLETNQKFIEAYMVGLNHEMARELLWREYPTDQRGAYFRQFWDAGEVVNRDPTRGASKFEADLRDITPLHEWTRDSKLGDHAHRDLPTGREHSENAGEETDEERRLVLVIRGDLLKRYPTAVIYAQEAKWEPDPDDPAEPPRMIRVLNKQPLEAIKSPIFKAQIEPDLYFLGFDLKILDAKGDSDPDKGNPGWFFVIQERPGEPRFGLDILDHPITEEEKKLKEWNDLSWDHLGDPETIKLIDLKITVDETEITFTPDTNIHWGSNAADIAYILFQLPVMVAIHAANMLP